MSDQQLYQRDSGRLNGVLAPINVSQGIGRCVLAVTVIASFHASVYWWVTHVANMYPTAPNELSTIAVEFNAPPAPAQLAPNPVVSMPAFLAERKLTESKPTKRKAAEGRFTTSTLSEPKSAPPRRQAVAQRPAEKHALVRPAKQATPKPAVQPPVKQIPARVSDASSHRQTSPVSEHNASDPSRVSGALTDATLPPRVGRFHTQNPVPDYPMQARRRHMEGLVVIAARINIDGKVVEANVNTSSGHDLLDEKALAAVRTWQFEPAQQGASAVERWLNVPINFSLH